MTTDTVPQTVLFPDLFDKPLFAKFDQEQASSDGGAVLLKAAERVYGLVKAFARCLSDKRAPEKIRHTLADLIGQRIFGIACGHPDCNDAITQFLIVTRTDSFANLQAALVAHLTAGGNENYLAGIPAFVSTRLTSYASIGGGNTSGNDAPLADLWPLAGDPPFVWFASPSPFERLERSRANVSTRQDNAATNTLLESMVSFGRLPYRIDIDGAEYEVGRYRTMLARPVDVAATPLEAAFRVQYRYAPAPPEVPW